MNEQLSGGRFPRAAPFACESKSGPSEPLEEHVRCIGGTPCGGRRHRSRELAPAIVHDGNAAEGEAHVRATLGTGNAGRLAATPGRDQRQ